MNAPKTSLPDSLKLVTQNDVRDWYLASDDLAESLKSIGLPAEEVAIPELPYHLQVAIESLTHESEDGTVSPEAFHSISFFSLCTSSKFLLCRQKLEIGAFGSCKMT